MAVPSHVVFVVPFLLESSLRFAAAAGRLPGVRLAILSQDMPERLPEELRPLVDTFQRVPDAMNSAQLVEGVRVIARKWGGRVDRVMGILEQLQVPLAEVREQLGVRGMDVEEARHFRDKSLMKLRLAEHGLPCARHCLAPNAEEARAFAARVGYPLVVKPPAGAGSRNTFRVESAEDLEGWLRSDPPLTDAPAMVEEFITGEEYSFDTITLHGKHLLHSISRYRPGPLEVIETPWIQWTVQLPRRIDGSEFDEIKQAGPRAIEVLGIQTGLTHMEWFRRPKGGIAISEVAARPPGAQFTSLLSFAHDHDFYSAWARLIIFEEFDVPERKFSAGAAYLRGQGNGRVVAIHGLEAVQRELGPLIVEQKLPRIGQVPTGAYDGEGFLILRHPETEVVARGLEKIVSTVRVELA
ncbi:MAG: ATP-grasp domain-containing protein [Planctomycetes bacterium]|nr:ATP-grasp domain-containing protein [Planctomycetota bacterium]